MAAQVQRRPSGLFFARIDSGDGGAHAGTEISNCVRDSIGLYAKVEPVRSTTGEVQHETIHGEDSGTFCPHCRTSTEQSSKGGRVCVSHSPPS